MNKRIQNKELSNLYKKLLLSHISIKEISEDNTKITLQIIKCSKNNLYHLPKYKKAEHTMQCMYCFYSIEPKQFYRKLPLCNHVFHKKCVDSVLQKNMKCPFCNTNHSIESMNII